MSTTSSTSVVALAQGSLVASNSTSTPKEPKSDLIQAKDPKGKGKSKSSKGRKSKSASMSAKANVEKGVEETKLASMSTKSKRHRRKHKKSKSSNTSNQKQASMSADGKKEALKSVEKPAEVTGKAEVKVAKVAKSGRSKSKRKSKIERTTVTNKSNPKLTGKLANAKPDENQASLPVADKLVSRHSADNDSSSKFRRLPRYTCEQVQKEWRCKLSIPRIAANAPPGWLNVVDLVRDCERYGFCVVASGRFSSSHAWYAICSPMGDIIVEDNLDFERVPGVSKLLKDPAIIKVPHKQFKSDIFGSHLVGALCGSGFSVMDIRSAKADLWKRSSGRDFELGSEKDWSDKLMKQLASDLCGMVWATVLTYERFVSGDHNVLPHVRHWLLGQKVLGEAESPKGPINSEWGVSVLGSLAKEDIYYTQLEDLDLPMNHDDVIKAIASVTPPATEYWRKRDRLPTFRRKGIETARYSSSMSCRFCAGQPACQPDACLDQDSCRYPLCVDSEESHAILTCNTLLNLCSWCGRRGHTPDHHATYTLAVLESYFLLFAKFGLKTSYLFLANDAKLGKFVNSNAWRYGLFALAPYEYPKQPVVLGLQPPRVPENSIQAHDGVSKKAEKRKSAAALKREAKQARWAEAVQLMKPEPKFLEFTNSPQTACLLDEPMEASTSVEVTVDDVAEAVSSMGLPSESLARDQQLIGGEEAMAGVEFGSVSQKEFLSLINEGAQVQLPPEPEANKTSGEY